MIDYGTSAGHSNGSQWADNALFDAPTSYSWFIRYRFRALFDSKRQVWAKGAMSTGNSGWGFEAINRVTFAGDEYDMRHIDGSNNTRAGIGILVGVEEDEDHSVGATWDGSFLQVYHDGIPLGPPQAFTQSIGANGVQLTLGNHSSLSNGAPVALGQWLIYVNHVLTESEMAALHVGQVIPRTDKLSWWVKGDVNPPVDSISGVAATNSGTVTLLGVPAVDEGFQGEEVVPMHREIISRDLRRNRYANLIYRARLTASAAADELADPMNLAHYGYARAESLVATRERDQMVRSGQPVFGFLTGIGFEPNEYQFEHNVEDYEHAIATFWSTLTLPFSVDEEHDGLAEISVGGEQRAFTRDGQGWIQQGDGTIATLQPNMEKMNHLGFLSEAVRASVIDNTSFQDGLTTGWTDNTGNGLLQEETTDLLFKDTEKYPRTATIIKGSLESYITHDGVVFPGAGGDFTLQIIHKDVTGRTSWRHHRDLGSLNYWNDTTAAWQAASVWNLLPDSEGEWKQDFSRLFGGAGTPTIHTLDVGIESGAQGGIVRIGHVDIQNSTNDESGHSPVPVDNGMAPLTANPDRLYYVRTGDATKQLVYAKRYTIRFSYTPYMHATDMTVSHELLWHNWDLTDEQNYVVIFYGFGDGGEGALGIWHEATRGGGADGSAKYIVGLNRGQTYEIACRLTDSSGYELGLPPRTLSVFLDGVKGFDAYMSAGFPTDEPDTEMWIGSGDPGESIHFPANGIISNLNIQQRAIPDEEILALR